MKLAGRPGSSRFHNRRPLSEVDRGTRTYPSSSERYGRFNNETFNDFSPEFDEKDLHFQGKLINKMGLCMLILVLICLLLLLLLYYDIIDTIYFNIQNNS